MYNTMKTDYECATIIEDSESSDEEYILMPKKEKKIVKPKAVKSNPSAFTPDDLITIEKKMAELAKKDEQVTRKVLPRDEAIAYFKSINEHYKAELIAAIPAGEDVSLYTEGNFTDLCRGPHVPSTGKLKVFKLMKLAGAYWRGDAKGPMLTRLYGISFPDKKELKAYLDRIEEAKKRLTARAKEHSAPERLKDLFGTLETLNLLRGDADGVLLLGMDGGQERGRGDQGGETARRLSRRPGAGCRGAGRLHGRAGPPGVRGPLGAFGPAGGRVREPTASSSVGGGGSSATSPGLSVSRV